MTLADIKRLIRPGQEWDVTNHYITRPDHPGYGTTRRTVTKVTHTRFYLTREGSTGTSPIDWPKAAQVSAGDDGAITLRGGGLGQKPGDLFLTLRRVRDLPGDAGPDGTAGGCT